MARKGRLKTNLFVKPNAQRQSRQGLSDAMARKGRLKTNENNAHAAMCSMLSTSWQICLYSAVIPLRGFSTRAKVLKFKHIPSPLPHFFARRPHFSFVFAHLHNGLCNNFVCFRALVDNAVFTPLFSLCDILFVGPLKEGHRTLLMFHYIVD